MAHSRVALVLLAVAGAAAVSCSDNIDSGTCSQKMAESRALIDVAALLQGSVGVKRGTGSLSGELEEMDVGDVEERKPGKTGKGAPTINIEFGGDKHAPVTKKGYLPRPEAIKSTACNANGCEDCSDAGKCFHGKTEADWGWMLLDVQAGSAFTYYVAEVWARCPMGSTTAQWWLEVGEITNGKLELYAGSTKVDVKGKWARFPITGNDKARVRALFYPTNMAQNARAKIWLEAYMVDPGVDGCMAVKDCLDMLGDGSDASFKMRNGNEEQYKCLSGQHSGMSGAVLAKCQAWDNCVTKSDKKPHLLGILGAALKKKTALLEGVSFANENGTAADAAGCVNPASDDPESWDCDCVEGMIMACKGQNLESCMHVFMCQDARVCCSWKQTHCPQPVTCTAALMEHRSQVSTKVATSDKLADDLDGSLGGKCAEQ